MKKTLLSFVMVVSTIVSAGAQKKIEATSPDGKLRVTFEIGKLLTYTVTHEDDIVVATSPISMTLSTGEIWGEQPKLKKIERKSIKETISAPIYKKASINDEYNLLNLTFKGDWGISVRVYNEGIAYRFRSFKKEPFTIKNETVAICFDKDYNTYTPYVKKDGTFEQQFFNSFENVYTYGKISQLDKAKLIFLPIAVELDNNKKVCFTEADLESYPGLYLNNPNGNTALKGVFAPYPKTTKQGGHNMLQQLVTEREPYIAKVSGKRDFPWRVAIVSTSDKELANCDMVYKLGAPTRIESTDWIKPGKVAWEWWNDWNIYNVDFKSGINNETYKYYIDFASRNGIEYIILDEGWSVNKKADLMQVIDAIDIPELVQYGKERNVGIILWGGYEALRKDMENVCQHYSQMGVKGFKVDFMDRDDQEMVDFMYKMAETAARHHLVLDMHGAYKPTGIQRTYPNVLNNEGVNGLEQAKWSPASLDMVEYDVTIPFIRMIAGPMDYTQGAMRNASKGNYAPINSEPMSQGTRCRQLATYVIFESPLNMLCDSPSNYENEKECLDLIAKIPVIWDETIALDGKIGDYVVIARRNGHDWYIGGLTDWTARDMEIDLSFLGDEYKQLILYRDGVNAHRAGRDYKKETITVPADKKCKIHLAPGGGFVIKATR